MCPSSHVTCSLYTKECYYSQSTHGKSLARHMDERHEETKGPRGWLSPSRRSLSWLIYLSEDGGDSSNSRSWDAQINGGLLRTFPQKRYRKDDDKGNAPYTTTIECGSHNGNLQVGWLLAKEVNGKDTDGDGSGDISSTSSKTQTTHPVFLDSWFNHINPHTGEVEPHCILYIVRSDVKVDADNSDRMSIKYITVPWSIDAVGGGNVVDFLRHHAKASSALFLQPSDAQTFHLLEDRDAWTRGEIPAGAIVEDFPPTPGMLGESAYDCAALKFPLFSEAHIVHVHL